TNQLTDQKKTVTDLINNQTTVVSTKLDAQTATVSQKLDSQTVLITDAITDFKVKSNKAVDNMQDTANKTSVRIIAPDKVKVGKTETIRLSASTKAISDPVIQFYCPSGQAI